MQINLQVTYTDNSVRVVNAIAADLVAFETKFDLSIARLEQNVKLTHLLFLAWHVEHRLKQTALDFDAWIETVEGVEAADTKK
jgi:hypothetical protein